MKGLQRPLKLTYGDGTEFTRDELAEFLEVYDLFGYPIKWAPGDIAVICNWRWAHGRPKIELNEGEVRELGVVLGPTFKRVGQKDGSKNKIFKFSVQNQRKSIKIELQNGFYVSKLILFEI